MNDSIEKLQAIASPSSARATGALSSRRRGLGRAVLLVGALGFALAACGVPVENGDGAVRGDASADATGDTSADASMPGPDGDDPRPDVLTPPDTMGPRPDVVTPPPDAPAGDATSPMIDTVSPTCVDGMYRETLPTGSESVADVTFNASDLAQSATAYLDRRYPVGARIVRGCIAAQSASACVDRWTFGSDRSSGMNFMTALSTVVHEAGHMYDLSMRRNGFGTYYLTEATTLSCDMGDTTTRGGQTFARSEIYADEFQSHFAACRSLTERNCDSYAYIYLDGTRADSGLGPMQGFSSVLEETTQYINSLATGYVFRDQLRGSKSERDGILAFLWYIERYLHRARLMHPEAYEFIASSECWRNAILTIWGRAWLYLEHTASSRNLEVYASNFMSGVRNPVLLDEIQRIRVRHGCR